MKVMCWCVIPGVLWAFLIEVLDWSSLELNRLLVLRRLLFKLPQSARQPVPPGRPSTHKPFLLFTTGGLEAGNDASYSSLKRGENYPEPKTDTKTRAFFPRYRSTITQYCRFSSLLTLCSHCSTNWVSFQNVPTELLSWWFNYQIDV